MTTTISPRRGSPDCGYATCPSSSSDDDLPCEPYRVGYCPHCHRLFEQPQQLQCGHSLCAECVSSLLAKQTSTILPRRNRIRMGLRSCALQWKTSETIVYRSPRCVVCGEPPKLCPPVPNLELQLLLRILPVQDESSSKSTPITQNSPETEDESSFSIRDCKIALVGGRGVGKSSLRRVQLGNDIVFTDILGRKSDAEHAIGDAFMIDIFDGNNSDADMKEADGFALVYSVSDPDSFHYLKEVYSEITSRRGPGVPVVVVAAKADQWKKRRVDSFDGQTFAREIGCPFIEVSAKRNDGVNEAFIELARNIEFQRLQC